MVKLRRTPVQVDESKVIVDRFEYNRKIDSLSLPNDVNGEDYVLVFREGESNIAISNREQFGGANFYGTNRNALDLGVGRSLASAREVISVHRDVNLALQGKGVVYDALGNLIDGDRLIQLGDNYNNTWVYLNDTFKKSEGEKGFLDLDIARVVGFDEDVPIFESEPLEEHVYGCFADIESINRQGFYTKKAEKQEFEQGKTVKTYKPMEGAVVGLSADSVRSDLDAGRYPQNVYPALGGFIRAEGTSSKVGGKK